MKRALPASARELRVNVERSADAIASAAQVALTALHEISAADAATHGVDLRSIEASARKVYATVHQQLTSQHFSQCRDAATDELQRIRHDLRGMLQNILLRCEILTETPDLPAVIADEIGPLQAHARACVTALNESRTSAGDESDVTPHAEPVVARPQAPVLSLHHAKILIADDDRDSCEILGRFLRRLGYEVGFAHDGAEAITAAASEEFDLILLDLVMPNGNGFDVLSALQARGILRHIPVILISGHDGDGHAIQGLELGAEDFLTRPVDLQLLRARVQSSLERQRLRERELGQHFTPTLARHLLRHPEVLATGRRCDVSVLFCDIVGFSAVSAALGPEPTIAWVGEVLAAMSECVMAEEGVLVDYTGDQLMALWGAPYQQPDHAARACRCATAMLAAIPVLDDVWRSSIGAATAVTIGVNSGSAFVGNIGTPQKFKFGALGNTVNVASRVQSANKYLRTSALITHATRELWKEAPSLHRIARAQLHDIPDPVDLYQLTRIGESPMAPVLDREEVITLPGK
jgi:adenylate cyclase